MHPLSARFDDGAQPARRHRLINIARRLGSTAAGCGLTVLTACGGGGGGVSPIAPLPDVCAVSGQVQTVRSAMEDLYFWNDIPEQNARYVGLVNSSFGSPDELLDVLRWRPDELDRNFTHITSIEDENLFFGPGVFIGYGFSFRLDPTLDELWITQVFAGSPAENAGFARGLRIVSIDGRTIAAIEAAEGLDLAFGESTPGITQSFTLRAPGGQPFTTSATKAEVTVDPVPQHRVIDIGGRRVGYVEFRAFIDPARAAMQAAFGAFAAAGIRDVIVDVRYNGGGLLGVADYFASLLAGPANVSKVLSSIRHNQANSFLNTTTTVSAEINSIDLDSVVFITTGDSASATEVVINSLEAFPNLNVALVGQQTFGKPVGQLAVDFCGQRLRLVAFETLNADLQGGFFTGLPVDCVADDELTFPIGDSLEDSLATALTLVTTGACPIVGIRGGAGLKSADVRRARSAARDRSPAREFSNAY
ncbi:MAG: S41 family peptidase [Gammaproteobacteria bacterium]